MEYQHILQEAFQKVVSEHGYLTIVQDSDFDEEQNRDIHEVALAHRLAYHLENSGCFPDHIVDLEYNRRGAGIKKDKYGSRFRPDIVIHVRGNNCSNLIMIEAKKSNRPYDREATITNLQHRSAYYSYQAAFLVVFPENNEIAEDSVIPV